MRTLFISLLLLLSSTLCSAEAFVSPDASPATYIHYREDRDNFIGYLNIDRDYPIDQTTYLQVKFALEDYIKRGVIFVILRLNTEGGEVFSAMKIAKLLQQLDKIHHIPVVAVINNLALSAGAMLAYSCRFIAVGKSSVMGAAASVVISSEEKLGFSPEEIIPALRQEFAILADYYSRNPLVAEAIADKEMCLVKRQGKIVELFNNNEIRVQGENPDELITPKGKLLTLNGDQLFELHVADFMMQLTAPRHVTSFELDVGEWPASQTQLFSHPFFAKIPSATVIYDQDWKIDFFAFLTNPLVISLLMMGFVIGTYIEMSHSGSVFPGIASLLCLGVILLSDFATETVHTPEILFFAIGILLLLVRLFALPKSSFLGVLGISLTLFGLFSILLPDVRSIHFSWELQKWNLQAFAFFSRLVYYTASLILALLIIALLSRYAKKNLQKKGSIVLDGDQGGGIPVLKKIASPLAGSEGQAFTSLCPGGKALIENHLYDALAETAFIAQGEKVVVVKIEGSALIVTKKMAETEKQ